MFYAEFTHVRQYGRAISGCEFQKLEQGPAPRRLLPVRTELVRKGDAAIRRDYFLGWPQDRLVPQRKPDMSVFTSEEVATIDAVLAQLAGLTGAQVSGLSHAEPGWKLTELHETIPYASALLCAGQVSTPTSRRLSRAAAATHGIELD